jgi:uncharacterized phiE125 gp8 family phage protein
MPLNLITPATGPVIDLDDVKSHLRVDLDDEDDRIQAYRDAAMNHVEIVTGRQLLTATWELILDAFPWHIELPKPPLQQIVSVTYLDTGNVLQLVDPSRYRVQALSGPTAQRGWIEPVYGSYWPLTQWVAGAVAIRFKAGYGDTADTVPAAIKQAMLLLIGSWYENREPESVGARVAPIPFGVDELLKPFKSRMAGNQPWAPALLGIV